MTDDPCLTALRAGGLVAFPTDTFFALSCDALNPGAVRRLRELKALAPVRPLPVLIPAALDPVTLGCRLDERARSLIDRHWPGKLTLIVPCEGVLAENVGRAEDGAVGIRVPDGEWLLDLLTRWNGPLVGTSANPTGRPPAVSPDDIRAYFGNQLAWVSPERAPGGNPSTVVDSTGTELRIEREGAIPAAEIIGATHSGRTS